MIHEYDRCSLGDVYVNPTTGCSKNDYMPFVIREPTIEALTFYDYGPKTHLFDSSYVVRNM